MSGYSDSRKGPSQIISLPRGATPDTGGFTDSYPGAGTDSFLGQAQKLELSLRQEKLFNSKLKEDLVETQKAYDRIYQETDSKIRDFTIQENKLKAAVSSYREQEQKLIDKCKHLSQDTKRLRSELDQYKLAWGEVLQREKEAKLILEDSAKNHKKALTFEQRSKELAEALTSERQKSQQLHRHAKTYQLELQSTLLRLHSAEAKFNELSKELKALSQSKKNMADEVGKLEGTIRERYEWQLIKETEKLRNELEKQGALERERITRDFQSRVKSDVERAAQNERHQLYEIQVGLENELTSVRQAFEGSQRQLEQARAVANEFQNKLTQQTKRLSELEDDCGNLKVELTRQKCLKQTLEQKAEDAIKSTEKKTQEHLEKQSSEWKHERFTLKTKLSSLTTETNSLKSDLELAKAKLKTTAPVETQANHLPIQEFSLLKEQILGKSNEISSIKKFLRDEQAKNENLEAKLRLLETAKLQEIKFAAERESTKKEEIKNLREALKQQTVPVPPPFAPPTSPATRAALPQTSSPNAEEKKKLKQQLSQLEVALQAERKRVEFIKKETQQEVGKAIKKEQRRNDRLLTKLKKASALRKSKIQVSRNKYEELLVELQGFKQALNFESERAESLEAIVVVEKDRFEICAQILRAEVEQLRAASAFKEMIAAQEQKILLTERKLKRLPRASQTRTMLENRLTELTQDRLAMVECREEWKSQTELQLQKINVSEEENTLLAESAEVRDAATQQHETL